MKVKVRPEDFVVREVPAVTVSGRPDRFVVYRLTKREWDTFDLVALVARRLAVPRRAISYGGIKDRFARTEQLLSVEAAALRAGPPQPLEDRNYRLEPLGYSSGPVTAASIRGNHFTLTLRAMDAAELQRVQQRLEALGRWGVPNYYDEQRFGSARHGRGWIGREIFLGRRERAVRLFFEPSGHDESRLRKLKTCVLENWGRWEACLPSAYGEYRRVLEVLARHPRGFRKALLAIDRRLLLLMLNSYQSFLFNGILCEALRSLREEHGFPMLRYRTRWGDLLFPESLPEAAFARLRALKLPVPGYDTTLEDPLAETATHRVLAREGISLSDLRVRQLPRMDVRGLQRPALLLPEQFEAGEPEEDELYPHRWKLNLAFFLPRGGYATLLIKRLQATVRDESSGEPT